MVSLESLLQFTPASGGRLGISRIRERTDDACPFRSKRGWMTRSHVLLHCPNGNLSAAREKSCEGKNLGGVVKVLLANRRSEKSLLRFLKVTGFGRAFHGADLEESRAT
jgi:hypothetical protein